MPKSTTTTTLKKAPDDQKAPADRDTCVYVDQFQAEVLNNCAGAIEGIASAMKPHDEGAGLAEALPIVWDK